MKKELENTSNIELQDTLPEDVNEITQTDEKPYKFRKLASTDIFLMFRIISTIGIKEFSTCLDFKSIGKMISDSMKGKEGNVSDEDFTQFGISIVLDSADVIFRNLPKCEKEIYQMLANTSNLTVEEITAEGNAIMFTEMVIDFLKKEEFGDFFKVVSKLFK
mgnify:CR=1 FL=1